MAMIGVRKRTPDPVSEQGGGGELIYKPACDRFARLLFVDVLVTQLGELCGERVFVGEAAQIEDECVVLYASDYRNR